LTVVVYNSISALELVITSEAREEVITIAADTLFYFLPFQSLESESEKITAKKLKLGIVYQ
jgi:hypothetical protein